MTSEYDIITNTQPYAEDLGLEQSQPMPKIKPLVFQEIETGSKSYLSALIVGRFRYMLRCTGKWRAWYDPISLDDMDDDSGPLDTEEEAIEFLQQEYERRVRSCLE